MLTRKYLLILLGLIATIASATPIDITVTGPLIPCGSQPPDITGICSETPGGKEYFGMFGASLTSPTGGNPNWVLTLDMNYGDPLLDLIPGAPEVIPPFVYDGGLYSIADFMIIDLATNESYGLVLSPHISNGVNVDSYQTGKLYKAPLGGLDGFVKSVDAFPPSPRPNYPVWVKPGGTEIGSGTVSGALTGTVADGKYTITAEFSAPADFLDSGNFIFHASSYVCANGWLTGTDSGGGNGDIPEPGTFLMAIPALAMLAYFARKRRQRA